MTQIKYIEEIPGLIMIQNILTEDYEKQIVQDLDSREWDSGISRRTQHYGYRYPYDKSKRLIPAASEEARQLKEDGTLLYKGLYPIINSPQLVILQNYIKKYFGIETDQCIVNEYDRNDTIGRHTDDETLFGDTVIAFSLLYPTLMRFQNKNTKSKHDIVIPPHSLIIMQNQARYDFTHEIPGRKTFSYLDKVYKKPENYRRVSVTFRKVKSLTHITH